MDRNRHRLQFALALFAIFSLALPAAAAELRNELLLSARAESAPGLASDFGPGLIATWSEAAPAGSPARHLLLARRLRVDLTTRRRFTVAHDAAMDETFFQCPVAVSLGSDRIAFAWLATTAAGGRRVGLRVTTDRGVPVGPARFAEPPTPGREASCPSIDGGARGFALAWPSERNGAPARISFRARSFDTFGAPRSPVLKLQPEAAALAFPPGLAVDSRGHFTVAWTVLGPDGLAPIRVRMRRFLRNGIPTAGTVEVAGDAGEGVALANFGAGEGEGVELAWAGDDGRSQRALRVQRFDRGLRPLAAARSVADATSFGLPSLVVHANGRSALAWEASQPRELGLFLDAELAPCGPPFPVHADRPVSIARVAFSSPQEAAFAVIEERPDGVRRLFARSYSLAACGSGLSTERNARSAAGW